MPRSAVSLARLLPAPDPAPADAPLLRAFEATRSEGAFEELVRRHGPMVLATCRRVLGNPDDAEDAFQAVFLVLARKANTVRGNLAGWLYAVSVRTARGVRIMRQRRRKHETRASARSESAVLPESDHDLAAVIDEELARLPEHYREAVVLCELRGLSRKEAASELGIPEGTLSWRLAVAKRKLAALLSARGLAPAAVVALLAPASVSAGLVESAVLAVRGTAGPVASAAASAVVKAMLFDQLKSVALTAGILLGVVCGGFAMTGSGRGEQPARSTAPAPRLVDDAAAKLVEQLGAAEFADREAAAKKLRELGTKAEPALRAGLKSEDPEVRDRCAAVLNEVRKDQLWAAFAKVAGTDKAARDLFAHVTASPRAVDALKAALDDPTRADELYRTRTAELLRVAAGHAPVDVEGKASVPTAPDVWAAPPPPLGDVAGWLFLGALQSGKAPWREVTHEGWQNRLSSHVPFLPEDDYTSAKPIAAAYEGALSGPLKKLTAAWLAKRRENDMLRAGLALAVRYDVTDAVAAARIVLKEPKPADVGPWNLASAAILVGLHGTKDDLPLLARHAADDRLYQTFLNLPPGTDLTFGAPPVKDGRDLFCHVRDAAAVAMCKLAGKSPADFGFPPFPATKHPSGKPMSLSSATKVGFKAKADRAAAFAKAKEWLDAQEKKDEPKKEEPKPDPVSVKLVEQLGAAEFADREAAAKELRALGARAEPALRAALKSEDPEIRPRASKILSEIRGDLLQGLVKEFDPAKEQQPDHPIWKRFKTIAGDTRAARDLFAGIIKNPNWLRRLDVAEANPDAALRQYQEAVIEVGKHFGFLMSVSFEVPVWPCDRGEEVAFLLLLGSHPNTATIPPGNDPERSKFDAGEGRIHFARGLELGLQGKMLEDTLAFRPVPGKTAEGTDRVFAKLLASWLEHREPAADVVPDSLWLAARHGAREVLPLARVIAADEFPHDRTPPRRLYAAALALVARVGTREDLPLFEQYFKDESVVATFELEDGKTGSKGTTQLRDAAFGLALVLHGEDPAKYGFVIAGRRWTQTYARVVVGKWDPCAFGFLSGDDNQARLAAHAKVKAVLDKQPKIEPKPARPR